MENTKIAGNSRGNGAVLPAQSVTTSIKTEAYSRWAILQDFERHRSLIKGLNVAALNALRAHLVYLGRDLLTRQEPMISYAAAERVQEKASLTARTLHRAEERLEKLEMVVRIQSGNYRRFCVRDRSGAQLAAYGVDLSPLLDAHDKLMAIVESRAAVRDQATMISGRLTQLARMISYASEATRQEFARLCRSLRAQAKKANATVEMINAGFSKAEAFISELVSAPCPAKAATIPAAPLEQEPVSVERSDKDLADIPAKMTNDDGQNVRHIESKSNNKKRLTARPESWGELEEVSSLYPEEPENMIEFERIMHDSANMLRIGWGKCLNAIQLGGHWNLAVMLDYMMAKAGEIRSPDAYFYRMTQMLARGEPVAAGRAQIPQ